MSSQGSNIIHKNSSLSLSTEVSLLMTKPDLLDVESISSLEHAEEYSITSSVATLISAALRQSCLTKQIKC